jgi:acetyl esterase
MSIDPRAKRLLDLLAAARGPLDTADISPAARRAGLDQLADLAAGPPMAVAEVRDLWISTPGGETLGARLYDPAPGEVQAALVFLHGGGWVAGSLKTHDALCRALAVHGRCKVLAPDYRRPPEHPHPAAVQDGLAALSWLAGEGDRLSVDPARIGVGGDSAGAHAAAEVCRLVCAADPQWDGPRPALQLLICPILDPAGALPSRQEFRDGHFIDPDTFARDRTAYFGAPDQVVSLLDGSDLRGLPSTLIHAAQYDPFRDEALAYADQLTAAGVQVRSTLHPGMIHYFYALAGAIPAARPILETMGRELAEAFACI